MLNLLANGLVLAGVAILVVSLLPVRRLMVQLAAGPMRRRWTLLVGLILLFILGYLTYARNKTESRLAQAESARIPRTA